MRHKLYVLPVIAAIFTTILSGCGSSGTVKNLSAEERFQIGKKYFDDEDYLEAIGEFEIVKLQYPGSAVTDDAQYYLAECRFQMEEFLLAALEYQNLKTNMSASPLASLAQYKIALCYYNLAPKSYLDQQYTLRAIYEFQAFLEYYPEHELASDAADKIKELNERTAAKMYDTAQLYMKLEYFKSATIYYAHVIEKYHDTRFAEPALIGKIRSLIARKKFFEAREEIDKYFAKYPEPKFRNDAESLRRDIDEELSTSAHKGGE